MNKFADPLGVRMAETPGKITGRPTVVRLVTVLSEVVAGFFAKEKRNLILMLNLSMKIYCA